MTNKYAEFYEIKELLDKDPNVRASAVLYPFDKDTIYQLILDRLAQPLPNGSASPFADRNPLSAEGQLLAHVVYLQELIANEINLIPDNIFYTLYRMLGLVKESAAYPLLTIELQRQDPLPVDSFSVPVGTTFASQTDNNYIITKDSILFRNTDNDPLRIITARYNVSGTLQKSLRENEFNSIPSNLPYLQSVRLLAIEEQGSGGESLSELMYRGSIELRRPGDRIVTVRDYQDKAINSGASQVAILPRQRIFPDYSDSYYDDVITIVTYPASSITNVDTAIGEIVPAGTRYEVIAAEVILLEGTITLSINASASQELAFNLAATAIANEINPPNGSWGEERLDTKIISAIRRNALDPETRETIIFDVAELNLIQVDTGINYNDIEIKPWQLFEIQSSIVFQYNFL